MKKIIVFILAVFYFAVSSGIIVNMHYCMNRFASADFGFTSVSKECDKCGMHKEESHGCCHDEVKLVKIEDEQKFSQYIVDFSGLKVPVVTPSAFIIASFISSEEKVYDDIEDSPPFLSGQDAYLQNCVFRI